MSGTIERPSAATFQAALSDGWAVEIQSVARGYVVRASHRLYGAATIGPKARLVPADVDMLCERVRDVEAPPLTYSQWLASGQRHDFVQPHDEHGDAHRRTIVVGAHGGDAPNVMLLGRALRLLATCIERGDVEPRDVAQALFDPGPYTLGCPVAEASSFGRDVAELMALLGQTAEAYGYAAPNVNDAPFRESDQAPSEVDV